ncbi:MAG TPA: amino acid adenylation domain-containing protein [Chitinophagaceae bacterium]|nr:amino acid adenylation domain-containing protein [Chitinophagaceae bacterium]
MQEELIFPLHPAQQDVYTDQLLDTKSPHYNIGGYIKLKGALNTELFYQAVGSGAKVFDAFKMRFDLNLPEPVFFIDQNCNKLEMGDLDFSDGDNVEVNAVEWMQNRFNKPFVIEKHAPLYEHYLLKISDEEHWFFGKYHHLITDGYGFVVWVQYLAQKYKSLIAGDNRQFEFNTYIDEANKASQYRNSSSYAEDGNYWEDKIPVKPEKILQRKYYNNSAKKTETYFLILNDNQRKLLADIEQTTKIRLHHLTIAALFIYFGKTSGESEFIFGIPVHKRSTKEARNIVGMFSGIIPYKNSFRKDITLIELLKEILETQKRDYKYQNYLIGDLARMLKVNSSESYLFDVTINYKLLNFEMSFGEELDATICELANEFQKNPLQLCWQDFGKLQPLQLQLDFSTDFFTRDEIELLAQRFIFILEQFPGSINKEIGDFDIVPLAEKKLIEKFNNKNSNPVSNESLIDLFEKQVLLMPDAIALVFEDEKLTYRELNEKSNQLARFLKGRGVKEETLVPICLTRSIEMLVAIMAILKAGGAYVPIDPTYPLERIHYMLEDTGAKLLIVNKEAKEKLYVLKNIEIVEIDSEGLFKKESKENLQNNIGPSNLAYIIYTSGSTGKPKGVMIEHCSVVNLIKCQSKAFDINDEEKVLQFSNYCFDASVEQIFLALLNGATLVLFREGLQLNIDLFKNLLIEKKITHLHATPSFLENLSSFDYSFLNRVIAGGDICKTALAKRWNDKVDFYNEYGPTETTVTAIEYRDLPNNSNTSIVFPIGKPLKNVHTYILDEIGQSVPVGVLAEIFIGGIQVGRGYLNMPELTQENFIKDTFCDIPGAKLYRTGDIGRWLPDGNIDYLARIDDQVKIRGYRIELGEVENVLQQSEMVHQVVVLAKQSKEGSKQLVGYIVPVGDFDKQAITSYLKSKLPDYMIPALLIELNELPLTLNGKVDKKALPNPDVEDLMSNIYEEPTSETEKELVQIWQELLSGQRVGINDNFFELGGHSLNAMQLSSRMHKLLNIKIDIGKIFSNPTIKELSAVLLLESQNKYNEIKRLPEQEYYDLSHAQKRFWILSHYKDGSKAYNFTAAYTIEGNLNKAAFNKAIQTVIERHENLRTVFKEIDGEPRQKILSPAELNFQIEEIDLRDNPNPDLIMKKRIESDSGLAYDLAHGPLLRAKLFHKSEQENILLFSIHHIISDGWSKGILINEILDLYKGYSLGSENNLPPLPIQYKDYAAWHNTSIDKQAKYWKDVYKNSIPVLDFPADFERPKVLSFLGAMLHIAVSETLTQDLRKMATSHNISLNNLLFSLYGLLVSQYSGQNDIVIGLLSSGRSQIELENLIGVFINFLAIRLTPDKDLDLSKYLEYCNHSLLEAYNNQDYPFDMMVDECIKQRDFSRNPFFDTMVNFHSENGMQMKDKLVENEISGSGISIRPYECGEEDIYQSVLDFKLDIEPSDSLLNFYFSYNSKLYSKERMQAFLDNFVKLLTLVTHEPGKALENYDNLTDEKEGLKKIDDAISAPVNKIMPVNICASFVAEPLQEFLDYWNKEIGLNIDVTFAPYNQVFQQLLNPDSLLNSNKGLNVLFIRIEDWLRDKNKLSPEKQINFLNLTYNELIGAIENVNKNTLAPFLVGIVPVNSTNSFAPEVIDHLNKLNNKIALGIENLSRMNLFDLKKVASLYDVTDLFDSKADEIGHMPFTQEYYAAIGTYLARKINAFKGPGYKVIVLDCDNTLWKGVCGEIGAMNVAVDENFARLQEFVLEKYNEGFLVVLCSKNNEDDVWEVFDNHPQMKLKRKHIASYRINWDIKSNNLIDISKELNLGIDSFIFIDDSEFEVEQMTLNCADVLSLCLPEDSNDFAGFLNHTWACDTFRVTEEDVQRNKRYQTEKERNAGQAKHNSLTGFIESLAIKVNVRALEDNDVERAVQLTMRTNQFNLNGIRKTPQEISKLISSQNSFNRIIEVSDRFGDYGIVGLVLSRQIQTVLTVETFLLSCRVLGRNVEDFILTEMQNYCLYNELSLIRLQFKPTIKNKPFEEFLLRTEWSVNSEAENYSRFLKITEQVNA